MQGNNLNRKSNKICKKNKVMINKSMMCETKILVKNEKK